eukprot:884562-Rhodomonas_salina.1
MHEPDSSLSLSLALSAQAVVLGVRDGQVLVSIGTDLGTTKEVKKSKGEKDDKKGKQVGPPPPFYCEIKYVSGAR